MCSGYRIKNAMLNLILLTGIFRSSNDYGMNALKWMLWDLFDESQHWLKQWLGATRQQAITWTNANPVQWGIYVAMGGGGGGTVYHPKMVLHIFLDLFFWSPCCDTIWHNKTYSTLTQSITHRVMAKCNPKFVIAIIILHINTMYYDSLCSDKTLPYWYMNVYVYTLLIK